MKYSKKSYIIEKMQYKDLGLYIKNKRSELNISLNQFAFTNDIDPAILSRIENLKQGIKTNILEKIARGFKKTPAQFLTEFEKEINYKKSLVSNFFIYVFSSFDCGIWTQEKKKWTRSFNFVYQKKNEKQHHPTSNPSGTRHK